MPSLLYSKVFTAVLLPPPPPDESAKVRLPEPSVCSTCPLDPSAVGKTIPDILTAPEPFALNSKSAFEAFVEIVLSVIVMPSRVDDPVTDSVLVEVIDEALNVPETCSVESGSEVPIPIRELVTSRYNKLVSNAKSTPLRVRLDFNTEPVIRPIAIRSGLLLYVSVSEQYTHTASLSLPADSSICI